MSPWARRGRLAVLFALFSGACMTALASPAVGAQVLPEGMERWPVVALMAAVAILSLSLAAFCVWRAFAVLAPLAAIAAHSEETARRLDEIAKKVTEDRARPCAMSTPEFREFLQGVKR